MVKRRERQAGKKQYERQSSEGKFLEVGEGDVACWVNLTDYLIPGCSLITGRCACASRRRRPVSASSTCSAIPPRPPLHAARGGAQHHQRRPVEDLPGLGAPQPVAQRLFRQAAPGARRRDGVVAEDDGQYELIFIDPPTFSNSKRMEGVFDVQRDHVELLDLASGEAGAGRGAVFLQQLPQVRTGRERAGPLCGRRDHWRNPRSGFRAQSEDPSGLENHRSLRRAAFMQKAAGGQPLAAFFRTAPYFRACRLSRYLVEDRRSAPRPRAVEDRHHHSSCGRWRRG